MSSLSLSPRLVNIISDLGVHAQLPPSCDSRASNDRGSSAIPVTPHIRVAESLEHGERRSKEDQKNSKEGLIKSNFQIWKEFWTIISYYGLDLLLSFGAYLFQFILP